MFTSRRNRHTPLDIWPGFVDALATLLMVIIFVLMTFVVSQLYLTDALSGREETIDRLNKHIASLMGTISNEKNQNKEAQAKIQEFEKLFSEFTRQIESLNADLHTINHAKDDVVRKNESLKEQIDNLSAEINQLREILTSTENDKHEQSKTIKNLDESLSKKVEELKSLRDKMSVAEVENKKDQKGLGYYRSEFFTKLQNVLGNRSDIRVVGDRFIFQSEVLFDKASAELGDDGKTKLDKLAKALKEIAQKIPSSVSWVLRVDGHTDRIPIHNNHYQSNWELSAARAIAVVKYLVENGISPHHLVAAGFGEHHSLTSASSGQKEDKSQESLARDRRIEFKLDQR